MDEDKVYEHDIGDGAQAAPEVSVQKSAGQIAIFLQNGDRVFQPCVLDDVTWETERKGAPGKLTFKVVKDAALDFAEGNIVKLLHNEKNLFMGYVFTKKRAKDNVITVTAYDQLRYLKNKDSYEFVNTTASDIIQKLAKDFRLKVGAIEDTKYVIPRLRGSNETLFDMMQTALDQTMLYTPPDPETNMRKLFVLYDAFGELTLQSLDNTRVDLLIDAETAENFSYESTIDKNTSNKIKLYYDNKETGRRETYYALDSANIARWGVLQTTESINPKQTKNPVDKVNTMLTLSNRVHRALSVSNALGDDRVRAGSIVYVHLNLGDITLGSDADADGKMKVVPMLVESAKHNFTNNQHTMDLKLRGNVIV